MKTNQSNINAIKFLILLITLAFLTGVSAMDYGISNCSVINTHGTYYLENDITGPGLPINITCDNVTIDGRGFYLWGSSSYGIIVDGATNVTIKDVNIRGFSSGIYLMNSDNNTITNSNITLSGKGISLKYSDNNTITNINITSNNNYGIYLENSNNNKISDSTTILNENGIYLTYSDNNTITNSNITSNSYMGIQTFYSGYNTITNSNITSNSYMGIYLYNSGYNTITRNKLRLNTIGIQISTAPDGCNVIYNNIFNNTNNFGDHPVGYWNTSKEQGGGNYWFLPDGTGWSETQNDTDGDGFCDSKYFLAGSSSNIFNNDYLPKVPDKTAPNVIINTPADGIYYNTDNITINVTVNDLSWISSVNALIVRKDVVLTSNGNYYTANVENLSNGNHGIDIIAIDTFGNMGYGFATFTVDTKNPEVTINTKTGYYNRTNNILNVLVTDSTNTAVVAEINGTENITLEKISGYFVNSTFNFSEGLNTVKIYATDLAGNLNSSECVNFTVDVTNPEVIINSPTNETVYYTNTILINVTANDSRSNISSVIAEIEGVRNVTPTLNGNYYTGSIGPLSSGNYSITIIANDTAGNMNQTTIQNINVVDSEPPVIINTTISPNPVNVGEELSFAVVTTDNFGISSVSVNGNPLDYSENNTYALSITECFTTGNYSWEVKVIDTSSNEKIEYVNFTVMDNESPVLSDTAVYSNPVNITENILIYTNVHENSEINSVIAKINGIIFNMVFTNKLGSYDVYSTEINTQEFTNRSGYFTISIYANDTTGNSATESRSLNVLDLEIKNALDDANVSIETDAWENVNSTGITTNETNGLNLTTIPTINGDALVIPEIEGVEIQVTNITFEIIENVTNAADSLNVSYITNETGMNNTANQILNSMQEVLNEGFVISNETQNTTTETVTSGSTTTTKAVARISFVAENTSAKGFVTVRIPIGDLTLSSVIVDNGTENITLTQTPNNSTGWYRIPVSGVLEVILVKDPEVMITLEKTLSAVTAVTTSSGSSGGNSYASDLSEGFSSSAIKNAVSNANVIYGSDIDMEFALKLRENVQTSENYELTRNTIIVGGPLANGFANQYGGEFDVRITNDYPGENKGVIQVKTIEFRDGNIIKTYQVIYIAGSDRFGTLAALEYFKTLDELPEEPIVVEWTENGPVLVE